MSNAAGFAAAVILGAFGGVVLLAASWLLLDAYARAIYAALGV